MTKKTARDPLREAIDALDLIGAIDEFIRVFLQSDRCADEDISRLHRGAQWFQRHANADRKTAVKKLKQALASPLPFKRLPEDLRWIRGEAVAPCFIPGRDMAELLDLIGPSLHADTEEVL